MNKTRKTVYAFCALFLWCACCIVGLCAGNSLNANAEEKKSIAVYVIAGQSNAAGYSLVEQVSEAYRNAHSNGYDNVYYYGRADGRYWNTFDTKVNFGLGWTTRAFGAEMGIAEKHAAVYPDQEAIIVKYAQGATYLVDTFNGITSQYGNWCSPSMPHSQGSLSGKLYKGLVDTLTNAVAHYTGLGYDIDFKGTFWMQGEAETDGSYAESKGNYEAHLRALITDLRGDYAKILNDDAAKESPFIIGKICPTFNKANDDGAVGAVRRIQDKIAGEVSKVYLVETEDYPTVDPATGANRGPDYFHFEGNDMVSLGRDVGETFITAGKAHVRVRVNGYGTANSGEYLFLQESGRHTVTFTPTKEHYVIKSVLYDGVDVTSRLIDNTFTITDTSGIHELVVSFEKEPKYSVIVEADEEMVTVLRDPLASGHYVGEKVTLTVTAKQGYKLQSVTWNGEAVQLQNDSLEITVSKTGNKLNVSAVAEAAQNNSGGVSDASGSGKNNRGKAWLGITLSLVGIALAGCVVAIVLVHKKRKINKKI